MPRRSSADTSRDRKRLATSRKLIQRDLFLSTSSLGDGHARTTRWLDDALASLGVAADCSNISNESSPLGFPAGFCSKTSLAFYRVGKAATCDTSSEPLRTWGMAWRGECLTLRGSASPSVAIESSLSDVLETCDVPPKYFLSPTACRGILRRAEKRQRTLPEALRLAMEEVARESTTPKTSSPEQSVPDTDATNPPTMSKASSPTNATDPT